MLRLFGEKELNCISSMVSHTGIRCRTANKAYAVEPHIRHTSSNRILDIRRRTANKTYAVESQEGDTVSYRK